MLSSSVSDRPRSLLHRNRSARNQAACMPLDAVGRLRDTRGRRVLAAAWPRASVGRECDYRACSELAIRQKGAVSRGPHATPVSGQRHAI